MNEQNIKFPLRDYNVPEISPYNRNYHIASILSREARELGMSYGEYVAAFVRE